MLHVLLVPDAAILEPQRLPLGPVGLGGLGVAGGEPHRGVIQTLSADVVKSVVAAELIGDVRVVLLETIRPVPVRCVVKAYRYISNSSQVKIDFRGSKAVPLSPSTKQSAC